MKFKFKQNDIISYKTGNLFGTGKIVGCATIENPVIGAMYIIQDLSENIPNKTYPFESFSCPECCLELLVKA